MRFLRRRSDLDDAGGRDESHSDDEVLDAPVPVRMGAGRPHRDPSADRRELPRLREVTEGETLRVQGFLERRSPDACLDGREARSEVDREDPPEASQVHDDRRRELIVDIEATDHVRAAAERNHGVATAPRELEETRDRILVFRVDDQVGDVVDPRGPEADEILVPSSGCVRHAREVIAREIPLADDALDVYEVLGRRSGRRDLDAVERCDEMPGGEVDLQAMAEVRRQGGAALEPEDLVLPTPSPPLRRSRVQHLREADGPIKTFLWNCAGRGPKGLKTAPRWGRTGRGRARSRAGKGS